MATITLTQAYAELNRWPGNLFGFEPGVTINTQTATTFSFTYPSSGVDFPDFRVVVTGKGFQYDGGGAIDGTMSRVRVLDGSGATVLTIGNLAPNTLASDFSQFYANFFGSEISPGDGQGPDQKLTWAHLLSGNDTVNGTIGNDWRNLVGLDQGNDLFNMLAGDDYVAGGMGNDTINGGDGYDVLSYSDTTYDEGKPAIQGVTINVVTGRAIDPWGGLDRFTGIEEFRGSRFNDSFTGGEERDRFAGGRGRDTIDGGEDSFDATGTIRTEDRRDEVRYEDDYWGGGLRGIVVDLETNNDPSSIRGTIRDGFGNVDRVIDIERVVGTRFDDTFVGSRMNNRFAGAEGRDSYDGEDGYDAIDFGRTFTDQARVGVVVDLSRDRGQIRDDGFGNIETAISIEELAGTDLNDRFTGNGEDNFLEGRQGSDTLTGRGGQDYFFWYDESEIGDADRVTDFVATGPNADFLSFEVANFAGMTGTAVVVNGTAATQAVGTFIFNAANDTLFWDADGTGSAGAVRVAVLDNVASLSAANFDLFV